MKLTLNLGIGDILIDDIKRTKRKTIGIIIKSDLAIRVRAPYWVRNSEIENFIIENKNWIEKKLIELKNKPKIESKYFVNGERFLYLGKEIKLCLSAGQEFILTETDELLIPVLYGDNIKEMLIRWYKNQANRIITERCKIISERIKINPKKIKINSARTRWGSCSKNGNVNFTWRLVMAPLQVIDYVILHELVHLVHHNHSKAYWSMVENFMPEYKIYEEWLKCNYIYINF